MKFILSYLLLCTLPVANFAMQYKVPRRIKNFKQRKKDQEKLDAALFEATQYGKTKTCKLLLLHGASCNALNHILNPPLHSAAFYGHSATAQLLLQAGSDVDYSNPVTLYPTALITASVATQHEDVVRVLLDHGANQHNIIPSYAEKTARHRNCIGQENILLHWIAGQFCNETSHHEQVMQKNLAIGTTLIQHPPGIPRNVRKALLTVLLIHQFTQKALAKLPKDLLLNNIFPYVWPYFAFTCAQVPRCTQLQLGLLTTKNGAGRTPYDVACAELALSKNKTDISDKQKEQLVALCTVLDPAKASQHENIIKQHFFRLNPTLQQTIMSTLSKPTTRDPERTRVINWDEALGTWDKDRFNTKEHYEAQ